MFLCFEMRVLFKVFHEGSRLINSSIEKKISFKIKLYDNVLVYKNAIQ